VQEEVHVDESEDEPVVAAVLENVEEGHGIVGEPVDEQCLQLSLQVVPDNHGDAHLLVEGVRGLLAVDLFLESC
jgi:hypothetical protein